MPLKASSFQTNFSAGELDPRMASRADLSVYQNGGENLLNNSPLVQGGLRRRPGTDYLATLTAHTRLEKMRFNETQIYLFAFSNTELKIFNSSGTLLQTLGSQPWDATTMWEMRLTTSGDTTIIVHEGFIMKKLLRTGATTFTITDFAFEAHSSGFPRFQPYFKFADESVTLTPSATSGTGITLTASSASFTSDHVGSVIRYKGKECDVTGFTSTTIVQATVRETLSGTSADSDWDENVFSVKNGFARSVAFHPRRLYFGGSRDLPSHIFSSKSNAFFNFDTGTGLDNESIQGALGSDSVSQIFHIHSGRHLQIFTDNGVYYIQETLSQAPSPSNFNPVYTVPFGVANATPRRYDGATVFIQDTGKVARELIWNDLQQSYTAPPISLVANDMLTGVQDQDVFFGDASGPEMFNLIVNSDGTLAIYHSVRSEKIAAWFQWNTTGNFESVTELNGIIYASVKRTINGATVYYLEKFNFDRTLDCSAVLSNVSGNIWEGLSHLVASSASCIDSNIYHGDFTVDGSGRITINETGTAPVAGLNYTRTIKDMPVTVNGPGGSLRGVHKLLGEVVVEVHDTVNFSVNNQSFLVRSVDDDLSQDPTPFTGPLQFYGGGWTREAQVTITQTAPLKATILSIWKEVLA